MKKIDQEPLQFDIQRRKDIIGMLTHFELHVYNYTSISTCCCDSYWFLPCFYF